MSSGRECCLPELQTKNNESRLSFDISDISGEVSGFLAIKSPMPFFWRSQNPCFQIHCKFLSWTKSATAEHINQNMIINLTRFILLLC